MDVDQKAFKKYKSCFVPHISLLYYKLYYSYLQGELTISSDMEKLMESLFMDHVPASWSNLAYPSLLGLAAWFSDLCLRLTELENWSGDFNVSHICISC